MQIFMILCHLFFRDFPRIFINWFQVAQEGQRLIFVGILVGRKWSKSFIDFTRFPTLRPQIFMPTDPDFWPLDLRFLTLGSKLFLNPRITIPRKFPHRWGPTYGLTSEGISWKFSHWWGLIMKSRVSQTKTCEFFKIQPSQWGNFQEIPSLVGP